MLGKISISAISLTLLATGMAFTPAAQAATGSCASITKALVVADGYKAATTPKLTPYNFANTSANEANALGTTIDFGAKAPEKGTYAAQFAINWSGSVLVPDTGDLVVDEDDLKKHLNRGETNCAGPAPASNTQLWTEHEQMNGNDAERASPADVVRQALHPDTIHELHAAIDHQLPCQPHTPAPWSSE